MKRDFKAFGGGGKRFGGGNPWERGPRRDAGRSFRDRDAGSFAMHEATCGQCGKRCEVPFRPNGKKPVFCNNCFKKDGGSESRFGGRSERPSYGSRPERSGFGRSERPSFGEKREFHTECDKCGDECTVPFKPTGEKPVYCRDCFGQNKDSRPEGRPSMSRGGNEGGSNELKAINSKLDQILKILNSLELIDEDAEEAEEGEDEDEIETETEAVEPEISLS